MSTSNVTILPRFNGEPMADKYTHRHNVTTAKGLLRVLDRTARGYGWGYRLEVSQALYEALGGYEAQSGQTYIPVDGRDPIAVYFAEA